MCFKLQQLYISYSLGRLYVKNPIYSSRLAHLEWLDFKKIGSNEEIVIKTDAFSIMRIVLFGEKIL